MTNDLPAHHLLSPSTAKRWMNCTGCIALYDKGEKSETSKYATEGTLAHFIAGWTLKEAIHKVRHPYNFAVGTDYWVSADDKGEVIDFDPDSRQWADTVDWHHFKVTQEMLNAVDIYVEYCQSVAAATHRRNVVIEKRFPIPSLVGNRNPVLALGGTVDFGAFIPFDRIVSVDYKHGAGIPVSVYKNEQLLSYALAYWLSLNEFDRNNISTVELVVVQPRGNGNGISSWECSTDDLLIFFGEMLAKQKKIDEGDTEVIAGTWCKWCPAGAICTVRQESVSTALEISVEDIEPGTALAATNQDTDRLIKIVEAKKPLLSLIESAEKLLEQRTRNGEDTGYEIAPKVGHRKLIEEKLDDLEKELQRYKLTAFKAPELKSPKQIEDMISAKNKARKAVGKKLIEINLKEFAETPITGEKLQKKKQEDIVDADFEIVE